ncbi:MAG: DUF1501 domain-containing protein [Planctomyces sp.]|jgi:hypothetical protein
MTNQANNRSRCNSRRGIGGSVSPQHGNSGGAGRRSFLQLGAASSLAAGVPARPSVFATDITHRTDDAMKGRAKSCIFIFLFGSPPQHETFDPKPLAPSEIQGEMKPIDTAIPGVQFGEGLPRIASIADRLTVVRSMTHEYPIHCCAYVMTGMPDYSIPLETAPRDPRQWPFIGSVVDYLDGVRTGDRQPAMPRNIGLPWRFCSRGTSTTQAGPYAAFLGNEFDPFWTDFDGKGTTVVPLLNADSQKELVRDPHAGIEAHSRFQLSDGCQLPGDLSDVRFDLRRQLLDRLDLSGSIPSISRRHANYVRQQQRAMSLIGSSQVRDALNVDRESAQVRDRYGLTLFGQSCLAARRLVEEGARFVSVFWDPFGPHGASVWDTHSNHFPRLRNYLLPVFDQAYSALISDLEDRGLLDQTLVICTSEHGRTPQIDSKPIGGARHHWSRAYSSVFAGGGVARGSVIGQTDSIAGDVAQTPISPKDMQATAYHLLGFDETSTIPDQQGRPHPIAGSGRVRPEFWTT